MRVLNDFICSSCGVTKEYFVESTTTEVRCDCGGLSMKKLNAPTFKEQTKGRATTGKALDRWARRRERQIKHERRGSSNDE